MAERLTVGGVLGALGVRAPFEKAASWDAVGLQVGDPDAPAARIAVCHEVTEAVVAAIQADPVDLLVAYHPLIFHPLERLIAGPTPAGRALRLARAGVALVVMHTAFDVAPDGAADALAAALGLREVTGFGPVEAGYAIKIATFLPAEAADLVLDAVVGAGAAKIGNYTHCSWRADGIGSFHAGAGTDPSVGRRGELNREPEVRIEFAAPRAREDAVVAALLATHPYEEPAYDIYDKRGDAGLIGRVGSVSEGTTLQALGEVVRDALGHPPLRLAGPRDKLLRRVAVIPGSGGDLLEAAAASSADAIVTGDVSHHRARELLDRGICLLDPGHVATERPGMERLLNAVRDLGGQCVSLLHLDPDPWSA